MNEASMVGRGRVVRLHHIGVAVQDIESGSQFYESHMGLHRISETIEDPLQKVEVLFLSPDRNASMTSGTCLELVGPVGTESPINRTLQRGVSGYHSCYEVDDLDGAIEDLSAAGAILVGPALPAVAFAGRRIAWLFLPNHHLIELLEADL